MASAEETSPPVLPQPQPPAPLSVPSLRRMASATDEQRRLAGELSPRGARRRRSSIGSRGTAFRSDSEDVDTLPKRTSKNIRVRRGSSYSGTSASDTDAPLSWRSAGRRELSSAAGATVPDDNDDTQQLLRTSTTQNTSGLLRSSTTQTTSGLLRHGTQVGSGDSPGHAHGDNASGGRASENSGRTSENSGHIDSKKHHDGSGHADDMSAEEHEESEDSFDLFLDSDDDEERWPILNCQSRQFGVGRRSDETWLSWWLRTIELLHPNPTVAYDPMEWFDSNTILALWYTVMAVQLAYTTLFLPIRTCFEQHQLVPWIAFDAFFDICCFIDVWVKMRTAVSQSGLFVTDRAAIWQRVRWQILYDVVAALPIDYAVLAAGSYKSYFRVNRLLRLAYFNVYFLLYERFNPGKSVSVIRLVKSSVTMLLAAHILGCGYFMILRLEGDGAVPGAANTTSTALNASAPLDMDPADPVWLEDSSGSGDLLPDMVSADAPGGLFEVVGPTSTTPRHPTGGRSAEFQGYSRLFVQPVYQQYFRCFYWAFVTMTGYGNTVPVRTPETVYSILVVLIGLAVFVNVIGTVGSMVSSLDAVNQAHANRMDCINDWMKYRSLPMETQTKVQAYYDYMWETRRGVEESALLQDLPRYLRLEVAEYINSDIIQKVPLFKDVSKEFLNAVVLNLEPRVVMGGNSICATGDVGAEMFFISTGSVNVVIETGEPGGKVVAVLNDGCFFGEVALIYQTKRTATVVAHTVCELYVLRKIHFEEVMDEFPEYAQVILEEAAERYKAAAPRPKAVAPEGQMDAEGDDGGNDASPEATPTPTGAADSDGGGGGDGTGPTTQSNPSDAPPSASGVAHTAPPQDTFAAAAARGRSASLGARQPRPHVYVLDSPRRRTSRAAGSDCDQASNAAPLSTNASGTESSVGTPVPYPIPRLSGGPPPMRTMSRRTSSFGSGLLQQRRANSAMLSDPTSADAEKFSVHLESEMAVSRKSSWSMSMLAHDFNAMQPGPQATDGASTSASASPSTLPRTTPSAFPACPPPQEQGDEPPSPPPTSSLPPILLATEGAADAPCGGVVKAEERDASLAADPSPSFALSSPAGGAGAVLLAGDSASPETASIPSPEGGGDLEHDVSLSEVDSAAASPTSPRGGRRGKRRKKAVKGKKRSRLQSPKPPQGKGGDGHPQPEPANPSPGPSTD